MVAYWDLMINAFFTGLGVAIGNEVWTWFKERRKKLKFNIPPMSEEEKKQFREQLGWKK